MKVAYITLDDLRRPSAMAFRIIGVANSLALAGAEVSIFSRMQHPYAERPTPAVERLVDVHYWGNPSTTTTVERARRFITPTRGLVGEMGDLGPDVTLAYGVHPQLANVALSFKKYGAVGALDMVEWYQPSHLLKPSLLPQLAQHEWAMRRVVPQSTAALCISTYLEKYLAELNVPALRVPPLVDNSSFPLPQRRSNSDGLTHIVVAGTVGGKESRTVAHLLRAASTLNQRDTRVVTHIIGPSRAEVLALPGVGPDDLTSCEITGRLEHHAVLNAVASADYVALQRPETQRFAKAGFPSKVVESWSVGTPVITNLSSDLAHYARDGENAVILESATLPSMIDGLKRAIAMRQEFSSESIRELAQQDFAPSSHSTRIYRFFERLCEFAH